jgi:hypothetical protein
MAERRRQNRANMPSRRSGGIGTTAGSILGVLDSLPSARNEEFDPEQAPTGENVPYKRGGMFARMTGSGVRADRQNNDAYDKWVDSKMADEEELRGVDVERRMQNKQMDYLGEDAGEDPSVIRQLFAKSKIGQGKAALDEALGKSAKAKRGALEDEQATSFRANNPKAVEGSMMAELEGPGIRNDVSKRGMSLAEKQQLAREIQFDRSISQQENEAGMRYDMSRRELDQRGAEGRRKNTVSLGDGRVMDVETGEVMDAGGAENFKILKKDALGNDVEVTETRNRRPGVYNVKGSADPAQGGRIKMNPKTVGEVMPNESGATDGDKRPVPLTGNEGKDGNERPLALEAQGGGGNPNGGRPPSWPSEEVRGGKLADITGKIKPVVGGPLEDDMISEAMLERMKRVRKPDYGTTREFTF